MPTYEYACRSCGERLEVSQSFSDEPLRTCPACGGELRKVFGAIGIAYKGSGFYKTDSRAKPAEAATSSSGSSSEAAKTDTKADGAKSGTTTKSDAKAPAGT